MEFCSPGRRPKAGNYPRIPGITPGLGLIHYPLSFATHRFALPVQSSGSAPRSRRNPVPERRTTCPSSDGSTHDTRRILLRRPAGILITVDDPIGRSHHPQARRLPRINSATGLKLTVPRSLLSLIRSFFRLRERRTVRRRTDFVAGFPPCGRPRTRHSGDRRFGNVAASDSSSISFVSYPPCK